MIDISEIKLAMFDLDGTLFDTEQANYLAYKEACGEDHLFSEDFFHEQCMSRSYKEFLPKIGIPKSDLDEVHKKKLQCYRNYFSAIRQNTSLFCLAKLLRVGGAKLSVVTTASKTNTMELLEYFQCETFFDLLVTQETVSNLKPFPDAYLYTMRHFGMKPAQCVIFEDSLTGLQAAMATGAAVYRISQF